VSMDLRINQISGSHDIILIFWYQEWKRFWNPYDQKSLNDFIYIL